MANNEHINKVVKSTGETLIDLTSDTVTAGTLLKDVTAHDRSGAQIEGAVIVAPTDVTETEDNTAYLYKTSGHDAVYDELVGGSVAWNQLIGASWDSLNKTEGTTFTQNSDGTIHISGTGSGLHFCNSEIEGGLVNGHKYLYSIAGMKAGITSQIYSTTSGSARYIVTSTTNSIGIFTHTAQASDISQFARFYTDTSYSGTTDLKYILIDLTQMFGTTIADYVYNLEQSTAGSGIAWLKSYGFFTEDYYAYNAGSLVSVNTSGKKVTGKNLLEITASSRTQNGVTFIVDKDNETITVNGTPSALTQLSIGKLENKGGFILSGCPSGGSNTSYDIRTDNEIDAGSSAIDFGNGVNFSNNNQQGETWIYLTVRANYTFNNLVFKPMIRRADVTDSTFEPYTSITYPIHPTDLRGLYKLNGTRLYTDGDIYSADGIVTRKYGIVDLGSLEWYKNATYNVFYTSSTALPKKTGRTNILCQKYTIVDKSYTTLSNKEITGESQTQGINIKDDDYSTSYDFKTAMSGVYLIYELATPTTENAQPFASPQIVYRNGTEEYLDTRDVPIPVGGNRKYVDIPEWMVNEYFDDVRADSSIIDGIKKEANTLEEHLKAFIIESNIGDPTRINNASDFTVELFDKIWGTNTDLYPRFAHLFLFGNEAHFLKAIIESIVVDTYTPTYTSEKLIQATFISEMSMYYFRWVRGQAPSMNKYTISVT